MAKWIQLDAGFYRHPKTLRLKRAIGPAALWVPPRLWSHCCEHETGDVSHLSTEDLRDVLEYDGDGAALFNGLKDSGFITPDGKTVTGWEERYGAKFRFYRERARIAAAARWGKPSPSDNAETRQDKTSKHRQASFKHASSILEASVRSEGVSRFTVPTAEEVTAYADSIGYPLPGAAWCDTYAAKGWAVGKNKMKDWKASVRTWKTNGYTIGPAKPAVTARPESTARRIDPLK